MPLSPAHTPMALLLVSMIAGLILARHNHLPPPLLLSPAFVINLVVLGLSRTEQYKKLWLPAFVVGSIICFWAYGAIRLNPGPSQADLGLPPREAQLTVSIEKTMRLNKRYSTASTLARVHNVPELSKLRPGDRIYLRLKLPLRVNYPETSEAVPQRGTRLCATGVLTPVHPPDSTEKRDFNTYLKSIGVNYTFNRISELRIVKPPSLFNRFCTQTNQSFQEALSLGAPANSELEKIYITMLLGNRRALTPEQNERYRTTGTLHFFAISGLHIGVIAAVIAQCLTLVRIPRNLAPLIGLPLLYLYVEITGASPSAMRAFIMAVFFWSSFAVRRQHAAFPALINSAVLVLLIDPEQLWSIGFQLSYIVVASIVLLGLPLHRLLKQSLCPYQWLPEESQTFRQRAISQLLDKVFLLFAISLSAWLASVPLCAMFFNFIAPGAVFTNMLLVYLVAIAIVGGMLSIGCATLMLPAVSEFINHAAWPVIYTMDAIVRLSTRIPNITFQDSVLLPGMSYAVLVAYFLSLFWLYRRHPTNVRMRSFWLPILVVPARMCITRCVA